MSGNSDFFSRESNWLDDVLRRRCQLIAKRTGRPLKDIAIEMGRVATMMGVSFIGNGLGFPADSALPIGEAALNEFQRLVDQRN